MAKKRLNIKDKTGLPVDYDISAENVTIDGAGGKPLTQKLDEIAETEAQAVRSITFNGQSYSRSDGIINIGEQEQPNWNESNPNYRTYIRNKPTLLSQFTNDCGFVTSSQIPEGADLSTVFASVAYDPTTSRINFFGKGSNTVLAYLDAAPFIVDGMVENVTLDSSTNELVITFNTASGKSPIRVPLGSISGQGTVQSVKMNGGTPIQPVNGVIDLGTVITEHQSLSSYATKSYVDQAVQQAEQGETVVINSDGANIVDEHNNNSVLLAPSARQMKLMYDNFMAVYNSLASIAFTNGKPSLDWIGTKTKYTLSYGTMTGCTADVAAGQVNEGGLRIKLTPTQSSYAFTSVTVNGESVSTTATGDADGSVYIDIIVNQNVTVSATAVSGYNVNIINNNSHCALSPTSIVAGATYNGTLNAEPHYKRPETITATMNGSPITFDGITNSYDKNTGSLMISNVTGDVAITATATILPHITVTFPADHDNMVIKHGNDELTGNSVVVYSDMLNYAITFQAKDGHRFDNVPSVGGTALPESGGIYTLTVDSVSADIAVTATTEQIPVHTLTINTASMSGCHIEYNGNEMTPTSNVVTIDNITDGSNVSFRVVPDAGYALQSLSYTIDNISQQTTNIDGTGETIVINNVTSNVTVVVAATASTTNYMFRNVRFYDSRIVMLRDGANGVYASQAKTHDDFVLSPIIDIEGKSNLLFHLGDNEGTDNVGYVRYFSDKLNTYAGFHTLTNETLSGSFNASSSKAARIEIPKDPSIVYGAWAKSGDEYLFRGSDYVDYDSENNTYSFKGNVKNSYDFFVSEYLPRTGTDSEKKINTGIAPYSEYGSVASSSCLSIMTDVNGYILTDFFDTNGETSITLSNGTTGNASSNKTYGLVVYKRNTDGSAFISGYEGGYESDRDTGYSKTIDSSWEKVALLVKPEGLADAWLKIGETEVWAGADKQSTE